MTKYESQIYTVNAPQTEVYARMADLRSFERIKLALSNPAALEQLIAQLPEGKIKPEQIEQAREQIEKMEFTEDTLSGDTKLGPVTLAIVERETPKLVKLVTQNAPVSATLWVQLLPKGETQTALKVTVGAELNFFIRKMVEKHLKQAPDGIASFLSNVLAVG